jgi:hypothetical protein
MRSITSDFAISLRNDDRLPPRVIVLATLAAWSALLLSHSTSTNEHDHHDLAHWSSSVLQWLLMILAMMLPLLGPPLAHVRRRSFAEARIIASTGFVLGYFSVWLVVVLVVSTVVYFVLPIQSLPVTGVSFGVATIWASSSRNAKALALCGATRPLAPGGVTSFLSSCRYGLLIGQACAKSCTPLMVACALTGHSIAAIEPPRVLRRLLIESQAALA